MKRLSLLCCLALASCGDLTVDFTLHKDASIGALQSLSIEVIGDEPFESTPLPLAKFTGDEATVRFVPTAKAGTTLHFVFHVVADSTFDVPVDVTLKDGHNPTDVTLSGTAIQPGDDMTMPPDMAVVSCTTAKDCNAATPVCSAEHVCTGCTAAADCTAFDATLGYCNSDGSCTVCQPKAGTCQDANTLKVCADDGSGIGTTTCSMGDCNACTGQCGAQYCEGTKVVSCDASGAKADVLQCLWQCSNGGCIVMLPSHFDKGSYSLASPGDITLTAEDGVINTTVNTTSPATAPTYAHGGGAAAPWSTFSNGIDASNVTFVVHNVTIGAGHTLTVTGPRNLVLAVTGNVQIDGTLDASSHGTTLGPGVVAPGSNYSSAGRGGGGHATAGGSGGAGGATGSAAGLAALSDTDITGTFKAGTSGDYSGYGGYGGGGGAVQITALGTITIGATGKILASGDGGGGGETGGNNWPGNGGGAGGSILLEASTVSIAGVLAANGGSGGGIDMSGSGINGVAGQASTVPAPAGMPTGAQCTGGKGGAGATAPTAGSVGANYGGGGGGAYGRVRVRVLGALPTFTGVISPNGADAYTLDTVITAPGNQPD